MIFDDVPGHPPSRPWTWEEASPVLAAVRELSAALTPAPPGRPWKGFIEDIFPDPPGLFGQIASRGLLPDIAGRLRDLGMSAADSVRGDTLVHSDLRDDNVILADTDEVWVCDWNWPTRGPIWADTLTVAISMVGDGLDGDRILVSPDWLPTPTRTWSMGFWRCCCWATASPQVPRRRRTPHRSFGDTESGTRG